MNSKLLLHLLADLSKNCSYPRGFTILCLNVLNNEYMKKSLFIFTRANRLVHSLGKRYVNLFQDSRPGIASTISANQFHLPKNGHESLKLLSKMTLKKWNTDFSLVHSVRKNRTTFPDVWLLPEIFSWTDPRSRVPFTIQPGFSETFSNW